MIVGLLIRHLQRFGVLGHVAVAVVVGKLIFRCSKVVSFLTAAVSTLSVKCLRNEDNAKVHPKWYKYYFKHWFNKIFLLRTTDIKKLAPTNCFNSWAVYSYILFK